jgi:predicted PhzF superfamily epimerase YddE/YHI9
MNLDLHLCDVFSERPLGGNSLSVVLHDEPLETGLMQSITRELRQFETVFVRGGGDDDDRPTRVFDLNRELSFAGHPLLGAAAVLHATEASGATAAITARALEAFSLEPTRLHDTIGCVVGSTGLRYLIVPIESGIESAQIVHPDLSELLSELDAEFAYVLDVAAREGRHWENDGSVEDIATGSAATVGGAFLVRHGLAARGERIDLRQGRFTGRPSVLSVSVGGEQDPETVHVAGPVSLVAQGRFTPW